MINILIADDNINYATCLMNYINKRNDNVRVIAITKNGRETLEVINNETIDIIILDLKMPIYSGNEVLDKIQDKNKYVNSCILISGDVDMLYKYQRNDMIYKIVSKGYNYTRILEELYELVKNKEENSEHKKIYKKIYNEIIYLKYNITHKGTKYLIKAIEYIALNPEKNIDNLEKCVYPVIATYYKDTIHNVKCSINRATNNMYYECDGNKLKQYFYMEKVVLR